MKGEKTEENFGICVILESVVYLLVSKVEITESILEMENMPFHEGALEFYSPVLGRL